MKLAATTIPEMAEATGVVFDRVRKTKNGVSFIKQYTGSFFSHMGEINRLVQMESKYDNVKYEALSMSKHSIKVTL